MVPGQGMAMAMRQTILGGTRTALWSIFGNSSGLVVWGAASAVGLSAIFRDSPLAYAILKWCGVAFLVWLALQTAWQLRNVSGKFEIDTSGPAVNTSPLAAYRVGLFTNLTNVKAAVFAVAFLPAYVPAGTSIGVGVFILGCIWAAVSLSWYVLLIAGMSRASVWLAKPKVRRALTGVSAVGLLALAIGLGVS